MAKKKSAFDFLGPVIGPVVLGAATIGVGALTMDWLKAKNWWPKPKTLSASGDCGCVGEDALSNAVKDLKL